MHLESEHLHAFKTSDGVMQPTHTAQGGCNSAANFLDCVEPCFAELRAHMLAWLDSFSLHAKDEKGLLEVLERFMSIFEEQNMVVSLLKSTLFSKNLKWCGRVIDSHGVRLDPSNFSGMRDADESMMASELCQYLYFLTWMRNAIQRFSERAAP